MTGRASFEALRRRAEQAGLQVLRTDPADGWVRYFVVQRQTVKELHDLDDIEALVNHLQAR